MTHPPRSAHPSTHDVAHGPRTQGRPRPGILQDRLQITAATRLINRDVPQEVIRVLLDHESSEMTAHYARITDQTVRRRWEQATKVNIKGERINIDPQGPLAQAQWAKTRYGIATQTLPHGYCGLPVQKSCPHANACFSELTVSLPYVRFQARVPGRVGDGLDHEAGVAAVEAGQGVVEADRGSCCGAGG